MWRNLHRNYLPILSGLFFLFIVCVVVLEVDRQVYQSKKKELCIRNAKLITPKPLVQTLLREAENYLQWVAQARREPADGARLMKLADRALATLDKETSQILHGDNCLISLSILAVQEEDDRTTREVVLSRTVDKYARQNTFANSLVLKHFWGETVRQFDEPLIGEVVFRYTSPRNIPEITALTRRYWYYIAGLVLSLTLLYYSILRYLIMPIKIVTSCIDRSTETLPGILPHPRTPLESAYNNLARDALLNAVTRSMAEYMSVDRLVSRDEIIGNLPGMLAPHFGFAAVYAVELSLGSGDDVGVRWLRSAFHDPRGDRLAKPSEADWAALGRQFGLDGSDRIRDFAAGGADRGRPCFAVPIVTDREERRVTFLAATPLGAPGHDQLRWSRDTLLRLAHAVRAALATLDLQRDLIVREKSKANISLSRSLGHDLTNVIATSKLELDTVRRILALPPERRSQLDPPMESLFVESLQGLLNNTKFLQEIINIYRSFSYVRHPQYERVNVAELAGEVAGLFELSLSRRVQLHRPVAEGVPSAYVEPRLFKLAVFNLLTNAMDALKRRALQDREFVPSLWLAVTCDAPSRTLTISVRDNGDGIRNQRGEPATPDEIRAIFHGGFTTKREGMAEGLGLNWVRQIVQDFHEGQLRARNHPEGGAEVSLVLPRLDSPPERHGSENGTSAVGGDPKPQARESTA